MSIRKPENGRLNNRINHQIGCWLSKLAAISLNFGLIVPSWDSERQSVNINGSLLCYAVRGLVLWARLIILYSTLSYLILWRIILLTSLIAASTLLVSLQAQAASDPQQAEAQSIEESATENGGDQEATPEPKAEEANDENRVICRRTQVIGSKFTKRICGTQAEWEELARKGQISTAEFQAKGAGIRQAGN